MKTILLNALFLTTLSTSANVKVPVKWPFLDLLAFDKAQHVEVFVHHGRILGHVVVSRVLEEDNNGVRDILANCALEIVLVVISSSFLHLLPTCISIVKLYFFFSVKWIKNQKS